MVYGVGADIMDIGRIRVLAPDWDDPFFVKTFTESERRQGLASADPVRYFAGRFAGKEAVFKSFRAQPDSFRFSEVGIVNDGDGKPCVILLGDAKRIVEEKGIGNISISLSSDGGMVVAFAVSEYAACEPCEPCEPNNRR